MLKTASDLRKCCLASDPPTAGRHQTSMRLVSVLVSIRRSRLAEIRHLDVRARSLPCAEIRLGESARSESGRTFVSESTITPPPTLSASATNAGFSTSHGSQLRHALISLWVARHRCRATRSAERGFPRCLQRRSQVADGIELPGWLERGESDSSAGCPSYQARPSAWSRSTSSSAERAPNSLRSR